MEHSHVQLLDAQNGFLRFEHEGKWGIVDMEGKILIQPKYKTLSVLDEKKRIFEAGNPGANGTLKKGIIDAGKNEEKLAVNYDYIETLDSGFYR